MQTKQLTCKVVALRPGRGEEKTALAVLAAAYRRDVAELAQKLKPQLMAGAFNFLRDCPPEVNDAAPFHKLEEICERHPRMRDSGLHLPTIMLSSPASRLEGELDAAWDDAEVVRRYARFCLAREVQAYATKIWGAPRDPAWGESDGPATAC